MKKFKNLLKIFLTFFKVGSFTFGGGLAMLPLIQKEVVDKEKWISEEEIVDVFSICQSLPGVIAINSAIFIGNRLYGLAGAIFAALGVILPAFLSIIIVFLALAGLKDSPYVTKVFGGVKAASAALILVSAIKLGRSSIKNKFGLLMALISFTIIVVFNINAVWAILFGGFVGYFTYLFTRRVS